MNGALLFVGACLLAAGVPLLDARPVTAAAPREAVETDVLATTDVAARTLAATSFRDRPLTQQPLTALEQRFAANFPGAIARYRTDGGSGDASLIVRAVTQPTRQLHPAADCFRAAGYTVGAARTHADLKAARWTCFEATANGRRWRVCERIVDAHGNAWTDVSSWYWSALWSQRGADAGPWWAVTLVTPLDPAPSSQESPQ